MATQCRSSRCTAERKGFRRELDSWRHKLIHCVGLDTVENVKASDVFKGFESILEGIYGPRLLQDLNIFDECEPETVDDWSMNANCSFCNLQLEKLNDHPAVAVPGSPPPAETPPPQGLSTSDKLQCQADRFLNAIFRKKEFPQSCDPSVPLVAQELMRKMIRRFALEYACKSQAHEGLNGLSDNSELLSHQLDRDGPLDLTISRASQALQVGVLDLSKKNTSAENQTTQRKFSGSLGPSVEDRSRLEKEGGSKAHVVWRVTVLEKVLSSLCSHHRLLLYHILKDMQEDYNTSVTLRDAHRRQFKAGTLCCHADKKSINEAPILSLSDCSVTAGICCRKACRLPTIAFSPLCICLRNIHGNFCQNTSMARVGQDICSNPTVCCTHSKLPSCQLQHNGDHTYISLVRETLINHQGDCNSHNRCKGSRSPSPPPLSPKPVDLDCKIAVKSSILQIQDCKSLNMAPPSLLPHRTEDEDTALYSNTPLHVGSPDECCEKVSLLHTQAEKENDHQCGSFIGDLMDRVTEKLRSIQPSEKEQNLLTHASQISKTDDTHLTEIITTVLHNSSDKDYNLNELLQQHVATEQRSPQTRSRKRLETLVAMSKSPDLPSSRRQSLQIKRDLARLSPSYFKRNIGFERERSLKTGKAAQLTYSLVEQSDCRKLDRIPRTVDSKPVKDTLENLTTYEQTKETQNKQKRQETQPQHACLEEPLPLDERAQLQTTDSDKKVKAKTHKEKNLTVQVGRARRNIVPPQRFSSYVTEPRKMYFAACFSESIFTKHSPNDSTSTALGSTEEIAWPSDTCDKQPFQTEDKQADRDVPQNITSSKDAISSKKEPPCVHKDNGRNPDKETARKRKPCQNSTSPLKRSKHHKTNSLNTDSHSPTETMSNVTTTESGQEAKASLSGLKYESPIKLMFVSSVTGEDGVKYTLKTAASSSNSHGEMFDPCVESSWAGSVTDEHFQDSVFESASGRTVEHGGNTSSKVVSLDAVLPSCSNNEDEIQETLPIVHETSPVKRRPGRPKKIRPHIVKSVKRPIGRPPKPKITDFSSSTGTTISSAVNHRTTEMSCKDDGNKNLKITIVNGRSRRAKRVVSEDLSNIQEHQHVFELLNGGMYSETCSGKTSSNDKMTKELLKDHHFVMPIEDRKCVSSSNTIKCQRHCDTAVSRKPGRPPKIKISGISVTVTPGSPRQRKIYIRRDTKDSHLLRKTLLVEIKPPKEQKTICIPTDIHKDIVDAPKEHSQNTRGQLIPVRHSVRERKPSIHLLHSVATARSCALVRRSRKLLLNKSSQNTKNRQEQEELPKNPFSMRTKNVSCIQDTVRFSTTSMDSIFSSNEGFRWWPTLASPKTLNEELARRIRLMSNTWVSDVLEANKSGEVKSDLKPKTCGELRGSAKKSASAIKMLFERNYNMEKLCTWFMQSTETQSLAIVKKTTARNPKDVFHYNLSRPNCKGNVCPSPQAERLRKHVKKFAKVVPKSPSMHKQAQELFSKSTRSQAKRKLFNTSFKQGHDLRHRMSRSRSTWVVYRTALLRARQKFKTRPRITLRGDMAHKVFSDQIRTRTLGAETLELLKEMPNVVGKTSRPITKVQNALKLLVKTPQKMTGIASISKQNRISSKAWSPESLKQCRVFLKKINSPNTKSATEECNNCTVKLYDVLHQEENEDVLVGGTPPSTINLPIQLHSSPKSQSKGGRKRGKQKSWSTSPSPPTKMLRQSRSSRGVLGARWCDFVLGH